VTDGDQAFEWEIYVMNADGSNLVHLTYETGSDDPA